MAGTMMRSGYIYEDECGINRLFQVLLKYQDRASNTQPAGVPDYRAGMSRGQKVGAGEMASNPLVGAG